MNGSEGLQECPMQTPVQPIPKSENRNPLDFPFDSLTLHHKLCWMFLDQFASGKSQLVDSWLGVWSLIWGGASVFFLMSQQVDVHNCRIFPLQSGAEKATGYQSIQIQGKYWMKKKPLE